MKNRRTMMLSVAGLAVCLVAAIGMTGCGSQSEEAVPEETTAVEETTTVAETTTAAQTEAQGEEIGEDAALEIALKDAGLTKDAVDYSNSHLDYDDGRTEYEVEFRQGNTEYDYTIEAYTGEILERSSEVGDD